MAEPSQDEEEADLPSMKFTPAAKQCHSNLKHTLTTAVRIRLLHILLQVPDKWIPAKGNKQEVHHYLQEDDCLYLGLCVLRRDVDRSSHQLSDGHRGTVPSSEVRMSVGCRVCPRSCHDALQSGTWHRIICVG
eukprot:5553160-Amphidinium_carterae.2